MVIFRQKRCCPGDRPRDTRGPSLHVHGRGVFLVRRRYASVQLKSAPLIKYNAKKENNISYYCWIYVFSGVFLMYPPWTVSCRHTYLPAHAVPYLRMHVVNTLLFDQGSHQDIPRVMTRVSGVTDIHIRRHARNNSACPSFRPRVTLRSTTRDEACFWCNRHTIRRHGRRIIPPYARSGRPSARRRVTWTASGLALPQLNHHRRTVPATHRSIGKQERLKYKQWAFE